MKKYLLSLAQNFHKRSFSPGSIILYQGEVPQNACIIMSGVVRVYSISEAGDDQIVTFHVEGEFFPASWFFDKSPSTIFFYEALTTCEIAFVKKSSLQEYIFSNQQNARELIDYLATSYTASLIRVNALEQSKARLKIVHTLYFLCERYGIGKIKNIVTIPMNLTHQNFASLVGLTRETTATEMSRLKKEKVIHYDKQSYRVNVQKLMDIIGEDSFKGITINDENL